MTTEFFTICARNYLGFATALGQSVKKHHPDARFTIWVLDAGDLPPLPPEIVARPITEAVDANELTDLMLRYSILEYATAVKPACMMRHFDEGAAHVIYLDPDIYLFRALTEVFEALESGAPGVLTPHIMEPLPRDGMHPDDLDLLRSGIYNLGFIALRAGHEAKALLQWWWSWLKTNCFADPSTGVFTDQKWINFVPLFWPQFHILRHAGYNIAYWNLSQRQLEKADAGWRVDGEELVFFHFSGFDPSRPGNLSKHQDRIIVKPWSELAQMLNFYAEEVRACGYEDYARLPLAQPCFDNGVSFDNVCRLLYQQAVNQGRHFANPLHVGPGTFFAWINEPVSRDSVSEDSCITRYIQELYNMRLDVRQAFPDLLGQDRAAFLAWAKKHAVQEMGIDARFLQAAGRDKHPVDMAVQVNYAGYLRAEMGVGEAARGYIRALQNRRATLSFVDVSELSLHRKEDKSLNEFSQSIANLAPYAINIIHANADHLPVVRDYVGSAFFEGRYNIGIWAWETPRFPKDWYDRFELLNEIWVGSSFMAEAIGQASPLPVVHMPHVVEVPDIAADRAAFGLDPDEAVFLFVFDFHSVVGRKNPEGVIDAFCRAFRPEEPVRLVIKSMHGKDHAAALENLQQRAGDARVTFLDKTLDSLERYKLIASCDAFVSLHRAEGFGLGIAEAMALGKPVIATGWSGNMDFMNIANSLPVAYTLRPLTMDQGPYTAGTIWAEPDLDHAAQLMRRVWEEPELAHVLGDRAARDIRDSYSAEAVGERMLERLRLIAERPPVPGTKHGSAMRKHKRMSAWRLRLRGRFALFARRVWRWMLPILPARLQPVVRRIARRFAHRLGLQH